MLFNSASRRPESSNQQHDIASEGAAAELRSPKEIYRVYDPASQFEQTLPIASPTCRPGTISLAELDDAVYNSRDDLVRDVFPPSMLRLPCGRYEGETIAGQPHGAGKLTYFDGTVYDGRWEKGKRSGLGEMRFRNGDVYRGMWKSGAMEGTGEYWYSNGDNYVGQWANGLRHGKGHMSYAGTAGTEIEAYDGDWNEDFMDGYGTYTFRVGNHYTGQWSRGQMQGKGIYRYKYGGIYEGSFIGNVKDGYGVLRNPDGSSYEGDWQDDKPHGKGHSISPDGAEYEGAWYQGMLHGTGTYHYTNGKVYIGQWHFNEKHGHGVLTHPDGTEFTGGWQHGIPQGLGRLVFPSGHLFDGMWERGVLNGEGRHVFPSQIRFEGRFEANVKTGRGALLFPENANNTILSIHGLWSDDTLHGPAELEAISGTTTVQFVQGSAMIPSTLCPRCQDSASSGNCRLIFDRGTGSLQHAGAGEVVLGGSTSFPLSAWTVEMQDAAEAEALKPRELGRSATELRGANGERLISEESFASSCYSGCTENGVKVGYGKYTYRDKSRYCGLWKANTPNGFGLLHASDGSTYEGNWVDGKPSGFGRYHYADGAVYEGQSKNGLKCGFGKLQLPNGIVYEGDWLDDKPHGQGRYSDPFRGTSYEGMWQHSRLNGHGVLQFSDGSVYTGQFKDNVAHGRGILRYAGGGFYDGDWENDRGHGKGVFVSEDGVEYRGQWHLGEATGSHSVLVNAATGVRYTGGFKAGTFHGQGTCSFPDGTEFSGQWHRGNYLGQTYQATATCDKEDDLESAGLLEVSSDEGDDSPHRKTPQPSDEEHDLTGLRYRTLWKPVLSLLPVGYKLNAPESASSEEGVLSVEGDPNVDRRASVGVQSPATYTCDRIISTDTFATDLHLPSDGSVVPRPTSLTREFCGTLSTIDSGTTFFQQPTAKQWNDDFERSCPPPEEPLAYDAAEVPPPSALDPSMSPPAGYCQVASPTATPTPPPQRGHLSDQEHEREHQGSHVTSTIAAEALLPPASSQLVYEQQIEPHVVDVFVERHVTTNIPLPVMVDSVCEFKLPCINPRYTRVDYPIMVPRFIEVPVPEDILDPRTLDKCRKLAKRFDEVFAAKEQVPSGETWHALAQEAHGLARRLPVDHKNICQRIAASLNNEEGTLPINYDRIADMLELAKQQQSICATTPSAFPIVNAATYWKTMADQQKAKSPQEDPILLQTDSSSESNSSSKGKRSTRWYDPAGLTTHSRTTRHPMNYDVRSKNTVRPISGPVVPTYLRQTEAERHFLEDDIIDRPRRHVMSSRQKHYDDHSHPNVTSSHYPTSLPDRQHQQHPGLTAHPSALETLVAGDADPEFIHSVDALMRTHTSLGPVEAAAEIVSLELQRLQEETKGFVHVPTDTLSELSYEAQDDDNDARREELFVSH